MTFVKHLVVLVAIVALDAPLVAATAVGNKSKVSTRDRFLGGLLSAASTLAGVPAGSYGGMQPAVPYANVQGAVPYGEPTPYGAVPGAIVGGLAGVNGRPIFPMSPPVPGATFPSRVEAPSKTSETQPSPSPEENPDEEQEEEEGISAAMVVQLNHNLKVQREELKKLVDQIENLKEFVHGQKQSSETAAVTSSESSGKHLALDIKFPNPAGSKSAPVSTGTKSKSGQKNAEEHEGSKVGAEKSIEMTQAIPVLTMKPDSIADAAALADSVLQEQKVQSAVDEEEARTPPEQSVQTPQERINDALEKIDKMEARKAALELNEKLAKERSV